MRAVTRRCFAGMSLGGLATVGLPTRVLAAAQCIAGATSSIPNRLAVDCASRQNFRLFRQYPTYFGLAGVVSMASAEGYWSTYAPGSMLLFPWFKPDGLAQRNVVFNAAFPISATTSSHAQPIPGSTLPQDEYLCRFVLRAPCQDFIGFLVDTPFPVDHTRSGWCSNIAQLADGGGVGVDWTSSNLNRAWFGGSNCVPSTDDCHGDVWRALIADGLNQVATSAC